jgi:hypothetical protein
MMVGEVGGNTKKSVMISDIMTLVRCEMLGRYEHFGEMEDTSCGVTWGQISKCREITIRLHMLLCMLIQEGYLRFLNAIEQAKCQ